MTICPHCQHEFKIARKKREPKPLDPRVKEAIEYFVLAFSTENNGQKPAINFGAAIKQVKRVLPLLQGDDHKLLIDFFMDTKAKDHPTINAAFSTHTVNLFLAQKRS